MFGGTFNPIHSAHLETAIGAKQLLGLDQLFVVVSADPPHKSVAGTVSAEERFHMVSLAVEGLDGIIPCDLEMKREGKSYTALTLEDLHAQYPDAELWLVIGSDSLQQFPGWYQPGTICNLAKIAAVPREGYEAEDAEAAEYLRRTYGASVTILDLDPPELSSTDIRNRFEKGLPVEGLLPSAVEDYLYESGLYFPDAFRSLQAGVKACLDGHEKRYKHTMAVVRRAAELASRNKIDPEKARTAALLHDAAKYLPIEQLTALSGERAEYGSVLHAFAGEAYVKERFGITDPEILNAIRLHSTGDADMKPLEMLLYLADLTEHTRSFPSVEELREASEKSLEYGMLKATEHILAYLKQENGPIHPATERAYTYYRNMFKGGTTMNEETKALAEKLARILYDKKAVDIIGIPVSDKTIIADWFLIASGRSVTQIRALADDLEDKAKEELGITPLRKEGYDDARWVVLDYGDILVHLFHPEERQHYSIERLWDTDGNAVRFSDTWESEDKAAQFAKLKAEEN